LLCFDHHRFDYGQLGGLAADDLRWFLIQQIDGTTLTSIHKRADHFVWFLHQLPLLFLVTCLGAFLFASHALLLIGLESRAGGVFLKQNFSSGSWFFYILNTGVN